MFGHFVGECMVFKSLLDDETRGVTFSPEEIATMANAYELKKRNYMTETSPGAVDLYKTSIMDFLRSPAIFKHRSSCAVRWRVRQRESVFRVGVLQPPMNQSQRMRHPHLWSTI